MRSGGRTDWQTGMTKLIVSFRHFAKAPKEMFQGKPDSSLPPVTPYLYSLVTVLSSLTQATPCAYIYTTTVN